MAESANTEFQYIFCPDNEAYLVYLGELVREHADALAAGFYRELMGKPDARVFLDNKLVDTKLRHSMAHWLGDLFRPRAADEQLAFVQRQNTIGEVHARIGVSLKLVQQGMRIIKRDLFHRLAIKEQNPERQIAMLLLADDLLDYAGALFNTQYVERVVESEGQIRSLRLHMSTQNLAVEIEALKAGH
jgi:diguanylate cyclase